MTTYDDKTNDVVASGGHFVLLRCKEDNDITFKASYIVVPSIKCSGKITALFDLVVLGDVEANEIDVKGRFICLGNCTVNGSIVVQNEIWANDLCAASIESHDRIVAQEIDGGTIVADGNIVVGRILAVEKLAKSDMTILCGETAYGAGKVAANVIITGEPLDLDDGEDAVVHPHAYKPVQIFSRTDLSSVTADEPTDFVGQQETEYATTGDYIGYLDFLSTTVSDRESKVRFAHWKSVLIDAEAVAQAGLFEYVDMAIVIWLVEIASSDYFKSWDKIHDIFNTFEGHFKVLMTRDKSAIRCNIESYDKWLEALSILSRFGTEIDSSVYSLAFELVVSNLGLKAKFVSERLNEKGWEAHGK